MLTERRPTPGAERASWTDVRTGPGSSELATSYPEAFFAEQRDGSLRSARHVVPLLIDLFRPRSVVDVGCGVGAWLAVFREHGISAILGIDGDHVGRENLLIAERNFLPFDLRRPLPVTKQFDLALCVEVAEHLPEECAGSLVHSLVRLAPVVVFSAAIPSQGGAGHLNEQWPDYWVGRFGTEGYAVLDCLRPRIWDAGDVEWWYAQNLLCFACDDWLARHGTLRSECRSSILRAVHPRLYLQRTREMREMEQALTLMQQTIERLDQAVADAAMRDASLRYAIRRLAGVALGAFRRRAPWCRPSAFRATGARGR